MKHRAGNVLFLILLAVVLFAALSYAVTQSNRSGGNNISKENAELAASQIIQYLDTLSFTIDRMILTGGVKLQDIDFNSTLRLRYNETVQGLDNSNCSTNDCLIFHLDGGGLNYKHFEEHAVSPVPASWQGTWVKPGHNFVYIQKFVNIGGELPELVINIFGIAQPVCHAFNRKLGLSEDIALSLSGTSYGYLGDPSAALNANDTYVIGDDGSESEVIGKHAVCRQRILDSTGYGDIYYVLKAR